MVWRCPGLREGCLIIPCLFGLFFVAVITMTFDRFLIDKAVAKDFVCITNRGGKARGELREVL